MSEIVRAKNDMSIFVENAMIDTFNKIFIVDVNTGEFEVFKNDGQLRVEGLDTLNVPDIYAYMRKLIDDQIVYPEYATACRRFTNPEYVRKSLFSGERRMVQSYRRRTANGDKWVTFAVVTPADCSPEKPIALFTWREADSDAITLLDTLPTISSLYDKLIRINLTNNTYEPVVVDADEQERLVGGVINMYEWWAGYSKNGNIASEDMGAFSTLTKAGSLQKRFAEDPTPVSFRYRRKVGDEFRWVQLEIAPSVEYSPENQIMLLSLKDIHEEYTAQMRSRQALIDSMNTDALTHLFNRLKYNSDIEKFCKCSDPVFTCLYVDVNGLHELNNHLGHQKGDDMLCCVADTLKKHFADELVYRIGGDEYVVLSTNMSKRTVELNIDKVRHDLAKDNYEISVGIASGACGESVEKIIAEAEHEMRNDKAAYYMRNGDRRRNRSMNEQLEQMLIDKYDAERFLDTLVHQFAGVFFVDLARDALHHIYIPVFFSRLLEETGDRFGAAMRLYIERYVEPAYHACFDVILDHDRLMQALSESDVVQFSYRKTDGRWINLRVLHVEKKQDSSPETLWIFDEEFH